MKAPLLPALALTLAACGDGAAVESPTNAAMVMGHSLATAADSPATANFKNAMRMMMLSAPAYTGNPDIDFARQMRGHHQAAIDMAEVELAHGKDPAMRRLATEVIAAQQREIVDIDRWLAGPGKAG